MSRIFGWTWRSAYALFIACALSFGAAQVFATTSLTSCEPNPDGIVRTCPPYNHGTCNDACEDDLYQGGACLGGCCECWL